MPELKDLVQFALDKQPSKFKDAFGELLSNRVVDKVEELKAEISANMFGEAPETDDDEDEDDIVDLDDEDELVYDDDDLPLEDDEDLLADFDLEDDELPLDDSEELDFDDDDEEVEEGFGSAVRNAFDDRDPGDREIDKRHKEAKKKSGLSSRQQYNRDKAAAILDSRKK